MKASNGTLNPSDQCLDHGRETLQGNLAQWQPLKMIVRLLTVSMVIFDSTYEFILDKQERQEENIDARNRKTEQPV